LKRLLEKSEPAPRSCSFVVDISLDKYIAQENIRNFGELLKTEFDSKKQQMLRRLLEIEKTKMNTILAAPKLRSRRGDIPF